MEAINNVRIFILCIFKVQKTLSVTDKNIVKVKKFEIPTLQSTTKYYLVFSVRFAEYIVGPSLSCSQEKLN